MKNPTMTFVFLILICTMWISITKSVQPIMDQSNNENVYGGRAYDGTETSDGGYVLVGDNRMGTWLIKTDVAGNALWNKW